MTHRIAILLCAGYGTRMGELTRDDPKPLLPVAGKPVLDYLFEQLLGLPWLDAVHVVTNSHYIRPFQEWADGWRGRLPSGIDLEIHDDGTRNAAKRLGAVGDLAFVLERAGAVDGALVASGDNILRFSLALLWPATVDGGASRVLALHEPDAARLRRTGVLELDEDQRVLRLAEKPDDPPSQWACPSIYWLSAAALARVGPYLAAGRPRDEIGRFLAWLTGRETLLAVPTRGERLHVGSPEAWRRADEILRGEDVIKPAGRRLESRDLKEDETLLAVNQEASLPPPSGDLERIFQSHHSQVYGTAYRVTGSSQDAEDVLQTVFLRLLRRQDEIDLSPSPGSYLHRAAVNAALDLMRARNRSQSIPMDDHDAPAENGHSDPDRRQQDGELRRKLRQALLELSPRSATIFTMRFLDGTPNREIAEAMGMSQAAVGVAIHRARTQVKKELATLLGEN